MGISPGEWTALMAALAREPDGAARAYVRLRAMAVEFFRQRVFDEADELADEVIDRVARRAAREEIHRPKSFMLAVARLVLMEVFKKARARSRSKSMPERIDDPKEAERLNQVQAALAYDPNAKLLLDYFSGTSRIRQRIEMAERMGIKQAHLRTRVHRAVRRLRKKIQEQDA